MSLGSKPLTMSTTLPGCPHLTSEKCMHIEKEPNAEAMEVAGNLRGVIFHEYVEGASKTGYLWASLEDTRDGGSSIDHLTLVSVKVTHMPGGAIVAYIDPNSIMVSGTGDGWGMRDDLVSVWVEHAPKDPSGPDIYIRNPDLQWRKWNE
jgi:hypothetical protein